MNNQHITTNITSVSTILADIDVEARHGATVTVVYHDKCLDGATSAAIIAEYDESWECADS